MEEDIAQKEKQSFYDLRALMATLGIVVTKGALRSYNFVSGSAGWEITADGDFEASSGTFRGAITASTIDIGGADASSFHVDADGNLWAGADTFANAPFSVSSSGTLIINDGTNDRILIGYQLNGF